jgi:hypothetical protein
LVGINGVSRLGALQYPLITNPIETGIIMKKKIVVAAVALVAGLVTSAPSVTRADTAFDVGSISVTQPDGGYDEPITLNGATFECINDVTKAKNMLGRQYMETQFGLIASYQSAWAQGGSVAANWKPTDPALQKCSFQHKTTESKSKARTFTVTNEKFGQGALVANCDMDLAMNVAFDYNMIIPKTAPTGLMGVLPATSASKWALSFAGSRKCTWTITFGASRSTAATTTSPPTTSPTTSTTIAAAVTQNTLTGTIDQDFTTLPGVTPGISFGCKNLPKTLCVNYTYTSKVIVASGTGELAGISGEGTQTDSRMVPAFLQDMPFEVEGTNAMVIKSSVGQSSRVPTLTVSGVKKAATLKSVIALNVMKATTATPAATAGTSAPSSVAVKLRFTVSTAKKHTCAVTGKKGTTTVTLAKNIKSSSTGSVATSLTSSGVRSKLGLAKGKSTVLTVTCKLGTKSVVKRFTQKLSS